MRGLEAAAETILDRRLARDSDRPLAVAFSGGGDSLALLLMADAWARGAGRELVVLTVDHRLQAESAAWTEACGATAGRLRRPFRSLPWEGPKPAAGLPGAARRARHALLAEAARAAGAQVILMGHTADDRLESAAMREAGSTTPDPREWGPSPAWPEGRGVFVLRPLLDVRRAALRAWLAERGESWIEDPANHDPRFARSRARTQSAGEPPAAAGQAPLGLAETVVEADGVLRLERGLLREAPEAEAARLLSLACVCAGGGARLPRAAELARLAEAVRSPAAVVATLAGSRVEADTERVTIVRNAGEAGRGGLAPAELPTGREVVWDGRYAITAARRSLQVRALAGVAARLPKAQRRRLEALPAAARGGLPAVVTPQGEVSCPALMAGGGVEARSLVGERLRAASGLIQREGR